MKKIVCFVAAAIMALTVNAGKPFGTGITVGAGYAMLHETCDVSGIDAANLHGFYLGGAYAYHFTNEMAIEPGLNFVFGMKSKDEDGVKNKSTLLNVAIPVNFTYSFDLGDAQLTLLAGPTLDLGILAKSKVEYAGTSTSGSMFDGDGARQRFNLYVGGGARLSFGQFGVMATYNYGLLNVYDIDNVSYKDSRITAGVTYSF